MPVGAAACARQACPGPGGVLDGIRGRGSRLEFLVTNEGREVFPLQLTHSPWFRCTDGSAYRLASFDAGFWRAWRRRDGSFDLTTSDGNTRFSPSGR